MKKKDIYGRTYTKFGYCLHLVLTAVGLISFLMMLAYTSSCEIGEMTLIDYVKVAFPLLAVFGASVLLHNKIFD